MSTKIMTAKQFDACLARVLKTRDKLKADIHSMCVYSLVHVVEHGNTTPLNHTAEACEGIVHNNAVRVWFNKVGKGIVKYDKDLEFTLKDGSKSKGGFVLNTELRKAIVEDEAKCSAMIEHITEADPYYVQTKLTNKDPDFVVLNLLSSIVSRADKRKGSDKEKDTDDFTGLNEVRRLVQRLSKGGSNIVEGGAIDITPVKRKAIAANVTSH